MSTTVMRRTERFSGTLQDAAAFLTQLTQDPEIPGDAVIVESELELNELHSFGSVDPERRSRLTVTLEWPA